MDIYYKNLSPEEAKQIQVGRKKLQDKLQKKLQFKSSKFRSAPIREPGFNRSSRSTGAQSNQPLVLFENTNTLKQQNQDIKSNNIDQDKSEKQDADKSQVSNDTPKISKIKKVNLQPSFRQNLSTQEIIKENNYNKENKEVEQATNTTEKQQNGQENANIMLNLVNNDTSSKSEEVKQKIRQQYLQEMKQQNYKFQQDQRDTTRQEELTVPPLSKIQSGLPTNQSDYNLDQKQISVLIKDLVQDSFQKISHIQQQIQQIQQQPQWENSTDQRKQEIQRQGNYIEQLNKSGAISNLELQTQKVQQQQIILKKQSDQMLQNNNNDYSPDTQNTYQEQQEPARALITERQPKDLQSSNATSAEDFTQNEQQEPINSTQSQSHFDKGNAQYQNELEKMELHIIEQQEAKYKRILQQELEFQKRQLQFKTDLQIDKSRKEVKSIGIQKVREKKNELKRIEREYAEQQIYLENQQITHQESLEQLQKEKEEVQQKNEHMQKEIEQLRTQQSEIIENQQKQNKIIQKFTNSQQLVEQQQQEQQKLVTENQNLQVQINDYKHRYQILEEKLNSQEEAQQQLIEMEKQKQQKLKKEMGQNMYDLLTKVQEKINYQQQVEKEQASQEFKIQQLKELVRIEEANLNSKNLPNDKVDRTMFIQDSKIDQRLTQPQDKEQEQQVKQNEHDQNLVNTQTHHNSHSNNKGMDQQQLSSDQVSQINDRQPSVENGDNQKVADEVHLQDSQTLQDDTQLQNDNVNEESKQQNSTEAANQKENDRQQQVGHIQASTQSPNNVFQIQHSEPKGSNVTDYPKLDLQNLKNDDYQAVQFPEQKNSMPLSENIENMQEQKQQEEEFSFKDMDSYENNKQRDNRGQQRSPKQIDKTQNSQTRYNTKATVNKYIKSNQKRPQTDKGSSIRKNYDFDFNFDNLDEVDKITLDHHKFQNPAQKQEKFRKGKQRETDKKHQTFFSKIEKENQNKEDVKSQVENDSFDEMQDLMDIDLLEAENLKISQLLSGLADQYQPVEYAQQYETQQDQQLRDLSPSKEGQENLHVNEQATNEMKFQKIFKDNVEERECEIFEKNLSDTHIESSTPSYETNQQDEVKQYQEQGERDSIVKVQGYQQQSQERQHHSQQNLDQRPNNMSQNKLENGGASEQAQQDRNEQQIALMLEQIREQEQQVMKFKKMRLREKELREQERQESQRKQIEQRKQEVHDQQQQVSIKRQQEQIEKILREQKHQEELIQREKEKQGKLLQEIKQRQVEIEEQEQRDRQQQEIIKRQKEVELKEREKFLKDQKHQEELIQRQKEKHAKLLQDIKQKQIEVEEQNQKDKQQQEIIKRQKELGLKEREQRIILQRDKEQRKQEQNEKLIIEQKEREQIQKVQQREMEMRDKEREKLEHQKRVKEIKQQEQQEKERKQFEKKEQERKAIARQEQERNLQAKLERKLEQQRQHENDKEIQEQQRITHIVNTTESRVQEFTNTDTQLGNKKKRDQIAQKLLQNQSSTTLVQVDYNFIEFTDVFEAEDFDYQEIIESEIVMEEELQRQKQLQAQIELQKRREQEETDRKIQEQKQIEMALQLIPQTYLWFIGEQIIEEQEQLRQEEALKRQREMQIRLARSIQKQQQEYLLGQQQGLEQLKDRKYQQLVQKRQEYQRQVADQKQMEIEARNVFENIQLEVVSTEPQHFVFNICIESLVSPQLFGQVFRRERLDELSYTENRFKVDVLNGLLQSFDKRLELSYEQIRAMDSFSNYCFLLWYSWPVPNYLSYSLENKLEELDNATHDYYQKGETLVSTIRMCEHYGMLPMCNFDEERLFGLFKQCEDTLAQLQSEVSVNLNTLFESFNKNDRYIYITKDIEEMARIIQQPELEKANLRDRLDSIDFQGIKLSDKENELLENFDLNEFLKLFNEYLNDQSTLVKVVLQRLYREQSEHIQVSNKLIAQLLKVQHKIQFHIDYIISGRAKAYEKEESDQHFLSKWFGKLQQSGKFSRQNSRKLKYKGNLSEEEKMSIVAKNMLRNMEIRQTEMNQPEFQEKKQLLNNLLQKQYLALDFIKQQKQLIQQQACNYIIGQNFKQNHFYDKDQNKQEVQNQANRETIENTQTQQLQELNLDDSILAYQSLHHADLDQDKMFFNKLDSHKYLKIDQLLVDHITKSALLLDAELLVLTYEAMGLSQYVGMEMVQKSRGNKDTKQYPPTSSKTKKIDTSKFFTRQFQDSFFTMAEFDTYTVVSFQDLIDQNMVEYIYGNAYYGESKILEKETYSLELYDVDFILKQRGISPIQCKTDGVQQEGGGFILDVQKPFSAIPAEQIKNNKYSQLAMQANVASTDIDNYLEQFNQPPSKDDIYVKVFLGIEKVMVNQVDETQKQQAYYERFLDAYPSAQGVFVPECVFRYRWQEKVNMYSFAYIYKHPCLEKFANKQCSVQESILQKPLIPFVLFDNDNIMSEIKFVEPRFFNNEDYAMFKCMLQPNDDKAIMDIHRIYYNIDARSITNLDSLAWIYKAISSQIDNLFNLHNKNKQQAQIEKQQVKCRDLISGQLKARYSMEKIDSIDLTYINLHGANFRQFQTTIKCIQYTMQVKGITAEQIRPFYNQILDSIWSGKNAKYSFLYLLIMEDFGLEGNRFQILKDHMQEIEAFQNQESLDLYYPELKEMDNVYIQNNEQARIRLERKRTSAYKVKWHNGQWMKWFFVLVILIDYDISLNDFFLSDVLNSRTRLKFVLDVHLVIIDMELNKDQGQNYHERRQYWKKYLEAVLVSDLETQRKKKIQQSIQQGIRNTKFPRLSQKHSFEEEENDFDEEAWSETELFESII